MTITRRSFIAAAVAAIAAPALPRPAPIPRIGLDFGTGDTTTVLLAFEDGTLEELYRAAYTETPISLYRGELGTFDGIRITRNA